MNTTKNAPSHAVLLAALIALSSAAGCALSVEADIPDVEVTQRGLVFTGVAAVGGEASMTKSYSQEHGKLDLPSGLDSEVKTLSVALTATGGVEDLSFIHHLRVVMTADGGGTPIELGVYQPTGAVAGRSISLTTLNPINILDAWNTNSATFTLEIAGALPTTDWTGDVTVHFAGTAKYKY